eukprot:18652-Heterococcus_DN1.PRE.3
MAFTSSRSSVAAVRSSSPSALVMSAAMGDVAKPKCDFRAIRRYIFATTLQCGAILTFMKVAQTLLVNRLPAFAAKAVVAAYFAYMSLRSRNFSLLDNSRPSEATERAMKSYCKLRSACIRGKDKAAILDAPSESIPFYL